MASGWVSLQQLVPGIAEPELHRTCDLHPLAAWWRVAGCLRAGPGWRMTFQGDVPEIPLSEVGE